MTANNLTAPNQVRIAWKLGSLYSAGAWHPASKRDAFQDTVDSLNKTYSDGTHWIEERIA